MSKTKKSSEEIKTETVMDESMIEEKVTEKTETVDTTTIENMVGFIPSIDEYSIEDADKALQEAANEFKELIDKVSDVGQLKQYEQLIIKVQDEYQSNLMQKEYTLEPKVKYEGKTFSKEYIAESITDFLNKIEVEWRATLGMYQLVSFWNNMNSTTKTIPYGTYDSTLRCLNQVRFKGLKQWMNILAINEYMSSNHVQYSKDTMIMYYLAQKHDIIMNRMNLNQPMQPKTANV